MAQPEVDFATFPVGAAITLGDTILVRTNYQDKMKAFAQPDLQLMIVCKDSKGHNLVAIKGDWTQGALEVDEANASVAYWMPKATWEQVCPFAAIKIGEDTFIHYDLPDRINTMATQSKELQVVTPDWFGFQLVADEGDLSRGLLMVDSDKAAVGYWMPKAEFEQVQHQQQQQPHQEQPQQ